MLLPKKVGTFTLMRKLGGDASSDAHLGILDDPAGKQVVARRMVLLPGSARLAEVRARVQDLMDVRHPALAPVLDIVEDDTDVWILEDWIDSIDLATVIDHCASTGTEVPRTVYLNIATQICNGLEALHNRPATHSGGEHVLHQAIGPEAIRLCADGRVVLGSYGLISSPTATNAGANQSQTRIGYLAPEQTHQDQELSPASDIFSLGAVLYELLTMRPMFRAESNLQTIHKVRRAEVTTQLLEVKEVLPGLDKVLFRAMSLNPRHRYQRAFVLREDLRGLMAGFSFADIEAVTQEFLEPLMGQGRTAPTSPGTPSPWGGEEATQDADTVMGADSLSASLPGRAAESLLFDESDTHLGDNDPVTVEAGEAPGLPALPPIGEVSFPGAPRSDLRPATAYDDQPTYIADADRDPRLAAVQRMGNESAATAGGRPDGPRSPRRGGQQLVLPAPDQVQRASIAPLDPEPLSLETDPAPVDGGWAPSPAPPPLPDHRTSTPRPTHDTSPPPAQASSVMYDDEDEEEAIDWAPYAAAAGIASLMLASLMCVGIVYLAPPLFGEPDDAAYEGIVAVPDAAPEPVAAREVPAPSPDAEPIPEPARVPVPRAEPLPAPRRLAVRTPAPARETFDAVVRTAPKPAPRPLPPIEPEPAPAPAPRARPAPRPTADPSWDPFEPASEAPFGSTAEAAAAVAATPAPAEGGEGPDSRELERMSATAFDGRLSKSDAKRLAEVPTSDLLFTRARTLLYLDAKARGAADEQRGHLALLMSLPENKYNPVLLVEQGRDAIGRKDWSKALRAAEMAERHWARLPSDLVFTRKALIYEIQALGNTGQFYGSEGADTNALMGAIRGWEKYRRHASQAGRSDLTDRADDEIARLEGIQERLQQ